MRYTPNGGNVAVALWREGTALHLSVQDDGPGIAATEQSHVFERFYRGLGHAANGSGLGLAIVRQAVLRIGWERPPAALRILLARGGSLSPTPGARSAWTRRPAVGLNGKGVGFFVSIPLPHKA